MQVGVVSEVDVCGACGGGGLSCSEVVDWIEISETNCGISEYRRFVPAEKRDKTHQLPHMMLLNKYELCRSSAWHTLVLASTPISSSSSRRFPVLDVKRSSRDASNARRACGTSGIG